MSPPPGSDAPPPRRWYLRLLAWLWPSVLATGLAMIVAGLAESVPTTDGMLALLTSIGLAAALAGPIALGLALVVRALWLGWRPHDLAPRLREPGGASPRLWAWLVYLALAAIALTAVLAFAVTQIARVTAFKPLGVAVLLPVYVVPAALGLVALSRPTVDGLAAIVRRLDRLVARRWQRPVATARAALLTAVGLGVVVPAAAWFVVVRPRIGFLDTRLTLYPILGAAVLAAGHRVARRRGGRGAMSGAVAATVLAVGVAGWVRWTRPVLILDLWNRPTVASEAIDRLVDLEAMRSELSVAAFRPVARAGAGHPDVVLVTFDTVRADRTPLLGGPAAMPNLAALGQRGALFEWAFAPGNVTRRSLPTIATGASPSRIRGKVRGWALRLDPRHVVMFERFRAAGYDTAGFLCCEGFFAPSRKLGLTRGFQHVVLDRDGKQLVVAARAWLEARRAAGNTTPVVIWLHFIETHNWLDESREVAGTSDRARYDFVLRKVDAYLGDLLQAFADRPPERAPIVAVTADHGEGLGDHGAPYHSSDLYNSQIRVPLVIAGPGVVPGRRREAVALADLAPTLLDLAGFEPPGLPQIDGRSLADLVTGKRTDDTYGGFAYAEMVPDRYVAERRRALVQGRWKLIEQGGRYELFDLRADPDEKRDLAALPTPPPALATMRAALAERIRLDRTPAFVTGH